MIVRLLNETASTVTIGWDVRSDQAGYVPTIDGSEILTDGKRHAGTSKTATSVPITKPTDGKPHAYGVRILGVLDGGSVTVPAPPSPPPPPPSGVTIADLKGANVYAATGPNGLQNAQATAGITHVRAEYWLCAQDSFLAEARRLGVKVTMIACYAAGLGPVDHGPPSDYVVWSNKMAARLANWTDVIEAVECWNEPWHPGFWKPYPDPAAYHRLCRTLLTSVRAQYPTLPFVFSSDEHIFGTQLGSRSWLGPLLTEDAKNGNVLRNDPYTRPSTHNYCGNRTPESTSGDRFDRWTDAYAAWGKPVWVTEYGWDTVGGAETAPVSETQQADYVTRGLRMMLASGQVERAHAYQWKTDSWYGWLRPDGTARPVCQAVKAL